MIDRLVVATDGSESGERAVEVALDVARRFDATICALSVVDTTDDGDEAGERDDGRRGDRTRKRERAEGAVAAVSDRADRAVETAVREGVPAGEIRAHAEERSADLVVTGTRGRDGEYRFLLGSVAEEVVRTCPVPVLTVRQLGDS